MVTVLSKKKLLKVTRLKAGDVLGTFGFLKIAAAGLDDTTMVHRVTNTATMGFQ